MPTKSYPKSSGGTALASGTDSLGAQFSFPEQHVKSWTDSFTGDSNPQWKLLVDSGQNATTTAFGVEQQHSCIQINVHFKSTVPGNKGTRRYVGPNSQCPWVQSVNNFDYSKADSMARMEFLRKYTKTVQGFSTGIFLGELRETLRMIRNPAAALRRGVDNYCEAARRRARKVKNHNRREGVHRVLRETWLEYSFGWAPLYGDIEDAVTILAGLSKTWGVNITGKAEVSSKDVGLFTVAPGGAYPHVVVGFDGFDRTFARYKGRVDASVSIPPTTRHRWGLRSEDFWPTVWELIPYSFLVDYFTNIGDVISHASQGTVTLAWGCKTLRGERSRTQVSSGLRMPLGIIGTYGGSSHGFKSYYKHFIRSPINSVSVGVSDLAFEVPGFGSKKWLNIGALFRQRRL